MVSSHSVLCFMGKCPALQFIDSFVKNSASSRALTTYLAYLSGNTFKKPNALTCDCALHGICLHAMPPPCSRAWRWRQKWRAAVSETCESCPGPARASRFKAANTALQSRLDEAGHGRRLPGAAARGAQIRRIVRLWVLRSRRHEIGCFVS